MTQHRPWIFLLAAIAALAAAGVLGYTLWNSRYGLVLGLPGEMAALLVVTVGACLALLIGGLGARKRD